MHDVSTIGDRLRGLRLERGRLTQEELAARSGVSVETIRKLEQGRTHSVRVDTLIALGNALDVPLSELVDKRPRTERDDGAVLAVRDVLISPTHLPGVPVEGEPASPEGIAGEVARGWRCYWAGRFGQLLAMVPTLVVQARATRAEHGTRAAGSLARAYQLAACLMVHMGRDELAAIGAERAVRAAAEGDDALQHATVHSTVAWVLLHQGRTDEAEQLAASVAERIEPTMSRATPQHLTIWGGLLLTAMAAAVQEPDRRRDAAVDYVTLAASGAARVDSEQHHLEVSYGPTQVAMQETYLWAMVGEPDPALAAARRLRRQDLHRISWGRHLLDRANAHLLRGQTGTAVELVAEASAVSAEWLRHQALARELVRELVERQRRLTPALRALAAEVGVR